MLNSKMRNNKKEVLIDRLFAVIENRPEPWHTVTHYLQDEKGARQLFYKLTEKNNQQDILIVTSTDTALRGGASIIEIQPKELEPIYRAAFDKFEAMY